MQATMLYGVLPCLRSSEFEHVMRIGKLNLDPRLGIWQKRLSFRKRPVTNTDCTGRDALTGFNCASYWVAYLWAVTHFSLLLFITCIQVSKSTRISIKYPGILRTNIAKLSKSTVSDFYSLINKADIYRSYKHICTERYQGDHKWCG